MSLHFYGRGENFVFTFDNNLDIEVYKPTYKNEKFQHSDEDSFTIGGSS